jgi:hypothetical protein
MIVLDNYTTVDEKILFDPKTLYVKIVDDSNTEESIGVGGFVKDAFFGVYIKGGLLHFCCNGKLSSAKPDKIKCTNEPISKDHRRFMLSLSDNVMCDFCYERNLSPVPMFGDDEEEYDILLYLSNLLKSKESIEKFISSAA